MIMKKNFLPIIALALSATACVSDADLDVTDNKGFINVSVSADNSMETRAEQAVSDFSDWTITVRKSSETSEANDITWSSGKAFAADTYSVTAKRFGGEDQAYTQNDSWGDAYYEGTTTESVTVVAGKSADATIKCGQAKNARLKVTVNSLPEAFTEVSVVANNAANTRTLTFNSSTNNKPAYFMATEQVSYTLKYKYNGTDKSKTSVITMNGAATENTISIKANDNGLINVTIKYDNEFGTGNSSTITIDAATGEQVSNS